MNLDRNDPIDLAIDEALASMVRAEPRRVSAASVRQAMGERGSSRLPVWLAAAALLLVAVGVVLKERSAVGPASVARSTEPTRPSEVRATPSTDPISPAPVALASSPGNARATPLGKGRRAGTAVFSPYEGLPRLAVASIDLPEPLSQSPLDADPIRIPRIEIAPLSISGLSTEQEHK